MLSKNNNARVIGGACLAGLLALLASAPQSAAGPGAAPETTDVMPAESNVLPNAPEVGDTSPGAGTSKASATHPDWPCVQRRVDTLTSTQIWDGPPTEDLKAGEDDAQIKELANVLESRRVPLEEAEKAIKAFAESQPESDRDQKLTLLFASVLTKINTDRKFVLSRIEEYQTRQKGRSLALERKGEALEKDKTDEVTGAAIATDKSVELDKYNWDARIFQERQQNLTMACEIPVLIEQRAYEIGKLIRAQMTS